MGRLLRKPPHASENRDWILQQYDHLHDPRGHEFEWFVGEEDRFKFNHRWITDDHIWWLPDYVEKPKPLPRVEIRKWIEQHLDGDVMVSEGRDSKKYYPKEEETWKYNFYNKYWVDFQFETEEDLAHFLIRWA